MKKGILIIGLILILLAVVVFSFVSDIKKQSTDTTAQQSDDVVFESQSNTKKDIPEGEVFTVPSRIGGTVQLMNFLKREEVVEDIQNPGLYYLGNQYPKDQTGAFPNYVISYIGSTNLFTITLIKEPLRTSRLEAEMYLKEALVISEEDMCQLNYVVYAAGDVAGQYTGRELKFSFCPGAVELRD